MLQPSYTTWILVVVTFGLITWDIFAKVKWGYEGTISRDILYGSYANPIIAFAAGLLCGHLFWPQIPPPPP